jgi:hypothetical protein
MRAMIPDVRLLFILREPVARFQSSYHFHRGKLNLPPELAFGDYLEACLEYAAAGTEQARARVSRASGIDEWFLKVLPFGCYARYLRRYFDAFPQERIRVTFHDDLCADTHAFMVDVSRFLNIDLDFWTTADYQPMNVTFFGRSRHLHRLAVLVNDRLEPLLRPRPRLKAAVAGAYKRINGAGEGYEGMSQGDRELLESFYAPHNGELATLLRRPLPPGWRAEGAAPWGAESLGAMTS